MSTSPTPPINGQWIDFYSLLGVPPDAPTDTLRRVISAKYSEASSNYDHRDLAQRQYYQAMVEQVLPQCRRVMLDAKWRGLYDEQSRLHHENAAAALDYVDFMATLNAPKSLAKPRNSSKIKETNSKPLQLDDSTLPKKLREEINRAQQVVQTVASGLSLDLLPVTTVKSKAPTDKTVTAETALPSTSAESSPFVESSPTPISVPIASSRTSVTATSAIATSATAASETGADGAAEAARVFEEAFVRVGGSKPYLESINLMDADVMAEARRKRRTASSAALHQWQIGRAAGSPYHAKAPSPAHFNPRQRVLSATSLHLITAIVAMILTGVIQYFGNSPATATAGMRVPLTISYSPEMRSFMEQAKAAFDKTDEGGMIELILHPQDSSSAMRQALGLEGTPPDVWIPSEALWSRQYNQLAAAHERGVISTASPLALTPLVLVARSDRAGELKKRFPNHQIPSWEALRLAVVAGAPKRLGITSPKTSGSGAIARYFMARDWCDRHNVEWNGNAPNHAGLWKWMASFEANVPDNSALTDNMVKDMVLGTRGLYWWSIAYESDALYWLNKGKSVEIFYLPQTNFADHPFCHVTRRDADPQARAARLIFERFLREPEMQQLLLSNGFRPTEIDLASSTGGNPFTKTNYRRRGLAVTGFPLDERLDYKLMNNLTAQWNKRFAH